MPARSFNPNSDKVEVALTGYGDFDEHLGSEAAFSLPRGYRTSENPRPSSASAEPTNSRIFGSSRGTSREVISV